MSKAKDLLNKYLNRKGLTTENIPVAAYTSCVDAIDEALNMHFVSKAEGDSVCPICYGSGKYTKPGLNNTTQTFICSCKQTDL